MPDLRNNLCRPEMCLVCNNVQCTHNQNPRFLIQQSAYSTNVSTQNSNNNMQMSESNMQNTNQNIDLQQFTESINKFIESTNMVVSDLSTKYNEASKEIISLNNKLNAVSSLNDELRKELNSYIAETETIKENLSELSNGKYGVTIYDPDVANASETWVEKKKLFGGTKMVLEKNK